MLSSEAKGSCPTTSSPKTSRLLALPTEVKGQILSHLSNEEEPTLMMLRRTHSSFHRMMPYTAHESKSWVDRERKLLNAEYMYPFSFPPNHYPCYGCLGVLKACWFRRKSIIDERDIGGSDAHWRHCINCTSNHAAGWECEMYVNISTFILYCVNIRGVSGSHTLIVFHMILIHVYDTQLLIEKLEVSTCTRAGSLARNRY